MVCILKIRHFKNRCLVKLSSGFNRLKSRSLRRVSEVRSARSDLIRWNIIRSQFECEQNFVQSNIVLWYEAVVIFEPEMPYRKWAFTYIDFCDRGFFEIIEKLKGADKESIHEKVGLVL